jgi:hypothetical protein
MLDLARNQDGLNNNKTPMQDRAVNGSNHKQHQT